jgi:hypothetical protein
VNNWRDAIRYLQMIQLNITPMSNGQAVPNAIITLGIYDAAGLPQPMEPAIRNQTNFYNSDAPYTKGHTPFNVYGQVVASGFQPCYFGPTAWNGSDTLNISPEMSPGFKIPTRQQLLTSRVVFQGVWVDLPGYGTVHNPWEFCGSLDSQGRQLTYQAERAAGATARLWAVSIQYREPGFTFPIPGYDYSNNLLYLKQLMIEGWQNGLYPCLHLSGDGQGAEDTYYEGGAYGFSWLMDNYHTILSCLADPTVCGVDVLQVTRLLPVYETVSYGGWTPTNVETFYPAVRADFPACHLIYHDMYTNWTGDGGAAWSSPTGMAIDEYWGEGQWPFLDGSGNPIPGDPWNGWQQRAAAFLGPLATNIEPQNRIAWEWPSETPRGPRYATALEICLYEDVRNQVTLAQIQQARDVLFTLGPWNIG